MDTPPAHPYAQRWSREGFQVVGIVLLAFYGVEVCPFLEQLTVFELGKTLAVCFLVLLPARRRLQALLDARIERELDSGEVSTPWRDFLLEFMVWSTVAAAVTVYNLQYYGFPVVKSGAKLAVGCVTLGLFAATDAALDRRGRVIAWFSARPDRATAPGTGKGSMATRVFMFCAAVMVVVSSCLVLLFIKDLGVLKKNPRRFHREVTIEVVFVNTILLGASLMLARRFGRNLEAMFELELRALRAVEQGDYETRVPLVSQDEFRHIASTTNEMIAGLAERDRIRRTFGRYLNPEVAEAILAQTGGAELGGREVEVAVLFSDIRNFTPLSERLTPGELVAFLNDYFQEMVDAVRAEDGVVDKFIGDAVMVVFGLQGRAGACDRAVRCAFEMRARLVGINADLQARGLPPVDNGVGVHFGEVIAGNIGSKERLEYTVIGDTVNVASRLESATKALGVKVAVSHEVRDQLCKSLQAKLFDLGGHSLKGKSGQLQVYGDQPSVSDT